MTPERSRLRDVGAATTALVATTISALGGAWICEDDPTCLEVAEAFSENNSYPRGQDVPGHPYGGTISIAGTTASASGVSPDAITNSVDLNSIFERSR